MRNCVPGYVVPLPRGARKDPVSLFRVREYVPEVEWRGPCTLYGAGGAVVTAGCLRGRLYLGREDRGLLLRPEKAFSVIIDCNNTIRSWHFELEVSEMRDCVEAGNCGD